MARVEKLREQIRREPDDDGLRLVWADALTEAGDARGEFVVAQVALAKASIFGVEDLERAACDGPELARLAALMRRCQVLLAAHEARWVREDLGGKRDHGCEFRRGMLWKLRLTFSEFDLTPLENALARVPLGALEVGSASDELLENLATLPLGTLRTLMLINLKGDGRELGRVLAKAARLRRLDLWGHVDHAALVRAYGRSTTLVDLALFGAGAWAALRGTKLASRLASIGIDAPPEAPTAVLAPGAFPAATRMLVRHAPADMFAKAPRKLAFPPALRIGGSVELEAMFAHPSFTAVRRLEIDVHRDRDQLAAITSSKKLGHCALALRAQPEEPEEVLEIARARSARICELAFGNVSHTTASVVELVEKLPLEALELNDFVGEVDCDALAAAFARPRAARWRRLELSSFWLHDRAVETMVGATALAGLRALQLDGNTLRHGGVLAIARSPQLDQLVHLDLGANRAISLVALRALVEGPPLLTQLRVDTYDPDALAALQEKFGATGSHGGIGKPTEPPRPQDLRGGMYVFFRAGKKAVAASDARSRLRVLDGVTVAAKGQALAIHDLRLAGVEPIRFTIVKSKQMMEEAMRRPKARPERDATGSFRLDYRHEDKRALAGLLALVAGTLATWVRGAIYDHDEMRWI